MVAPKLAVPALLVSAVAAVIVSRPLVTTEVADAKVLLVDVSKFVDASAPAAVIVSRLLVMANVAAANVLLVEVSRLVEASAPAAVTVSMPLVMAVVGRPLVMANVAAANVLLVDTSKLVVTRLFVIDADATGFVAMLLATTRLVQSPTSRCVVASMVTCSTDVVANAGDAHSANANQRYFSLKST